MQFNVAEGQARICSTLEYEVTFTPVNQPMGYSGSDSGNFGYFDDPYLSMTTFNWDWEKSQQESESAVSTLSIPPIIIDPNPSFPPRNSADVPGYLIIAATPYQSAVEEFASWKRMLGFNVHVAYKDAWTMFTIKDEISKYDDLGYLLFVGNNTQIPGAQMSGSLDGEERTIVSDFPYSTGITFNPVPKFSYGRIPVNNLAEASRVLKRIIEYEKNPSNTYSFYNTNLFISRFLGRTKTKANMRNAQTTYEISKYMNESGREVKNMFCAASDENPLFWNDYGINEEGNLQYECPIPTEMRKPQYAWDATPTDIISEMNNGYSQVFYYAHGDITCWKDPLITASDVYNLSNGKKLPVVFSMACMTGDYSVSGSFAEKFLTSPNGGAIGLFGFTNRTYGVFTDLIAFSLFNDLYPVPGVYPTVHDTYDREIITPGPIHDEITELGLLHRMAVTYMLDMLPDNASTSGYKRYEAGMLTLFGDPSMHINLTQPKAEYHNITQTLKGEVRIDSPYIVTLHNIKTGVVVNYNRAITLMPPSDASDWYICIHTPGIVPVVCNLGDIAPVKARATSANQVVEEGKVWRYHSDFNIDMTPSEDIYVDVCLSGVTEIDGKEYLDCYVWKTENGFSEESAALIAHMREEGGKVYVRYVPDANLIAKEKGIYIIPYAPMLNLFRYDWEDFCKSDILLFDSNLTVGDMLRSSEDDTICEEFTVRSIDEVECLGKTYANQWLWSTWGSYWFIEGIGDTMGLLPLPGASPISYSQDPWFLVKVLDRDGNVIFDTDSMVSGVESVSDEAIVVSETYRDLNGIEIAEPTQAGIYIRTQLLDNGKTRTGKFIIR